MAARRRHLGLRRPQRLDDDLRRDAAGAAAKDGLFPERVRRACPAGACRPFGIVASTVLASVAMVFSYLGASGATVFNTLVLMSGITAAIPYALLRARPDQVAAARTAATRAHPAVRRATSRSRSSRWSSRSLFIWYSRNTGEADAGTWSGARSSWPAPRSCSASRSTWPSAAG